MPHGAHDFIDFTTNELFHSPSGAKFCPRTGFVYLPDDKAMTHEKLENNEFLHEHFHYMSSMFTSSGFFLSSLRYARSKIIRSHIATFEPKRSEEFIDYSLDGRLIRHLKKSEIASILDTKNDSTPAGITNITVLRLAELIFLHFSRVIDDLKDAELHPAGILVAGISMVAEELQRKYNCDFPQLEKDILVRVQAADKIMSTFTIPYSDHIGRCIDTFDIFEAFSVLMDLSYSFSESDRKSVEQSLQDIIENDEYVIVLDIMSKKLNFELTVEKLASHVHVLSVILELSLEIENCSISSGINDGAEWCDIYPPAKLFKLLDIVGEYELDKFTRTNSNLWIFRKMLKDMFLKAKSHAKIPREYPFSHYINNIDHKTMEYTGEMPAPERCYDIMDYYCDLYFSFKEFEKSKFLEGITVLFDVGKLGEFKYIFPPLIVTNKQIIPLTEMLQASFIGLPYKLFTSLLGADEYLFGGEKVSLFPFEDDIYRHQDWYDMHLKLFISDLEQWKGDVQNT